MESLIYCIWWTCLGLSFLNYLIFLRKEIFYKKLLIISSLLSFILFGSTFVMPVFAIFLALPLFIISLDFVSIAFNKKTSKILIIFSLIQILIMTYIIGANWEFFGGNIKYLIERIILFLNPLNFFLAFYLENKNQTKKAALFKMMAIVLLLVFGIYAPDNSKEKIDKILHIDDLKSFLQSTYNKSDSVSVPMQSATNPQ